jgi:outer membrane receptor protein involved in Fe transport
VNDFAGSAQFEYGNFDSIRAQGMINVPIGDTLAARVAGLYVERDGFTENLFNGERIDGREQYAIRGSLRWEPGPDTTVDFMAFYFEEDSNRLRIQKQLCQRDPTAVLGCLNNRRDFDTSNSNSTFTGTLSSE